MQILSLINLNLTLFTPSLNRSSVYYFMRVSSWSLSRRRTTIQNFILIALVLKLQVVSALTNKC